MCLSALELCLVALDAEGHTPHPGILYGIDTRATAENGWQNDYFGQDVDNPIRWGENPLAVLPRTRILVADRFGYNGVELPYL